jgi:hypothetical protein
MRRLAFTLAVVAMAAGTAVACAHGSGRAASGSRENGDGAGPLVEYQMTGGLAGIDVNVVVFDDGRAEVTADRNPTERFVVGRDELDELRELLAAGNWDDAGEAHGDVAAADGYRYEIVYRGSRVTAADPNAPGWVIDLASELNSLAFPAAVDRPIPLPE